MRMHMQINYSPLTNRFPLYPPNMISLHTRLYSETQPKSSEITTIVPIISIQILNIWG